MTALLIAAALGAALGAVVSAALGIVLRTLSDSATADAWQRNYRAECTRHDATLAQLARLEQARRAGGAGAAQPVTAHAAVHGIAEATAMRFWVN